MIRTQIQLTEDQLRRVRALARNDGVSVAEVVRRGVDRLLAEVPSDRAQRYARAAELVGGLHDRENADDLAGRHDDYLAEAFE